MNIKKGGSPAILLLASLTGLSRTQEFMLPYSRLRCHMADLNHARLSGTHHAVYP